MARGEESTTQAIGRAAYAAGVLGLVVPSKPDPKGSNLVIFPERLTSTCRLEVIDADKLKALGKPAHFKLPGGKRAHRVLAGGAVSIAGRVAAGHRGKTGSFPGASAGVSVKAVRERLGLSQEELGRVTGYSIRSIAGWEAGQALSAAARQKLTETDRLGAAVAELMPAGALGDWLRTPNPAFEGQSPIQIMERGESDRLWQMIFQIDANVAN